MKTKVLLFSFMNMISMHTLNASPGQLDTTFGVSGLRLTPVSRADALQAITINPSDSIIITGITQTTAPSVFLAQYTSNGALDTANFNSEGSMPGTQTLLVGSRSEANAITLDASHKILVSGFASQSQTNILLARYNTNGALDTAGFNNPNGYVTLSVGEGATANGVGVQTTGNIVVAGTSVNGGTPSFTLARFTSAGALDTTFGTSGITITQINALSYISAVAIQSDDKIVAAGNSNNQITVVRYNADGSLDTSFGSFGIFQFNIGSPATVYDVALDSSGNIIVAGSTKIAKIPQSLLIRCTPSGALDTTFNTTGYVIQSIAYGSEFYSLTIQANNKIVVAGYAVGALSNQISLARYLTNGTLDTTFGSNGITLTSLGSDASVQDVQLQSTGNSITAGIADGTFFVARYLQ